MNFIIIGAALFSCLSTVLLAFVIVKINGLERAVGKIISLQSRPAARNEEPLIPIRESQALAGEMKQIVDRISKFEIILSKILVQLDAARRSSAADAPQADSAQPNEGRPPSSASSAISAVPSLLQDPSAAPPLPPKTDIESPSPPDPAVSNGTSAVGNGDIDVGLRSLSQLVTEYRELIAEPRKNEINRWSDNVGGWGCEFAEDGTLRTLARDAGGLLILITQDDQTGIVVPGGRLVVEFPTDFADIIAMRRVTRHAFELVSDGTGVLRLSEAAVAQRVDDRWQLSRPGRLSGFKSE